MRRSTLLWSVLAISVVIGLFVVKHRVQALEDRLHALNAEIITDRNAVEVMQAEWSHLNQPARLEALSKRLLGMAAPDSAQIVSMQEFLNHSTTKPVPIQKPLPPKAMPVPEDNDWLKPILAKLKKTQ